MKSRYNVVLYVIVEAENEEDAQNLVEDAVQSKPFCVELTDSIAEADEDSEGYDGLDN